MELFTTEKWLWCAGPVYGLCREHRTFPWPRDSAKWPQMVYTRKAGEIIWSPVKNLSLGRKKNLATSQLMEVSRNQPIWILTYGLFKSESSVEMRSKVSSKPWVLLSHSYTPERFMGASPINVLHVLEKWLVLTGPFYKEAMQCARRSTEWRDNDQNSSLPDSCHREMASHG